VLKGVGSTTTFVVARKLQAKLPPATRL
jgi:hypothetical protein